MRNPYLIARSLFLLCSSLLVTTAMAQTIQPYYGQMPVPPANKNMLFYLQRTIDVNTLIYEVNYKASGEINRKKPVKIYWIDYEKGGKTSPLTFVQNKFAYGIEFVELNGSELMFEVNLVSYKKIRMVLMSTGKNGAYQMHVKINNKPAVLTSILVRITGGTHLKPVVSHIELKGKEVFTGEELVERINPS